MSSSANDLLKKAGLWLWNNIFKQIWNSFIKNPWVQTIIIGISVLLVLRFILPVTITLIKGTIINTSDAILKGGGNILQLDGSTSLLSKNNMELYFNGLKQIIN